MRQESKSLRKKKMELEYNQIKTNMVKRNIIKYQNQVVKPLHMQLDKNRRTHLLNDERANEFLKQVKDLKK